MTCPITFVIRAVIIAVKRQQLYHMLSPLAATFWPMTTQYQMTVYSCRLD